MEPIGPLMWEHRTIERAVHLLEQELGIIRSDSRLNVRFLESIVDFFRIYADRTHHGKEEDLLFKNLTQKSLSGEHKKIIDELINDHVRGRKLIQQINNAIKTDTKATAENLKIVAEAIEGLLDLYPRHIKKEDENFFYPAMEYFTREEKDRMLEEYSEFDRQLIHEKYKTLLEDMGEML